MLEKIKYLFNRVKTAAEQGAALDFARQEAYEAGLEAAEKSEDFDFSALWQDEEAANFWKYVPAIAIALDAIILLVVIFRK